MKWQSRKNNEEEVSYWQTIADALAALLMVVLLILMLLVLYIVRTPDEEERHLEDPTVVSTNDYDAYSDRHWGGYEWHPYYRDDDDGGGGGGGGGGETTVPTETTEPTVPTETTEPHPGDDAVNKAAVFVRVLDAETERLIREEDVQFELYSDRDELQHLYTYYPVKTEFQRFATTLNGTFYLPEKLPLKGYYLHELTEPVGYDMAPDTGVLPEEPFDWSDPYVAEVRLYPSRNVIHIQLQDSQTGEWVSGGSYEVYADGDVVTMDGTLRYTDGQLVDTILCDENGAGDSIELYLGHYLLTQKDIPEYYASDLSRIPADVMKKTEDDASVVHELPQDKTTAILTVTDEKFPDRPVPGAVFTVYEAGEERETLQTNQYGKLTVTNLLKDTDYRLVQIPGDNGYITAQQECSFHVSPDGRIDGEPTAQLGLINRTLRLSVTVRDALLPGTTATRNVAVYNDRGEPVANWDTNGIANVVEGLAPGVYEIRINGQPMRTVAIENTPDVQSELIAVWTATSVAMLAAMILTAIAAAAVTVWLLIRKKKARKKVNADE